MYYPIFAAAPDAHIYGAGLTRQEARAAMEGGFDGPMDGEAAGIRPRHARCPTISSARARRCRWQAHCDALPEDMLPGMIRIQRLRDAMLARAALTAHAEDTGGPVAVITGNGHARKDWGMPAMLSRVAPEIEVRVIGQTEDDIPLSGEFDEVLSAPAPERDDPCAAFAD